MSKNERDGFGIYAFGIAVFFGIFFSYVEFINPYVHVFQQKLQGKAELARAESNRQIAILEAVAKKESSRSLADVEVIRAEGVAKANKIIGDSLQDNEGYLRYLYITHLAESQDKTVIYIPTEAGLPILEAKRLN
jgi:regulator of protease activity HflC (stomatin/prohibitin superfamily)